MYLRFETKLNFQALARTLCAELTEDDIDWDHENVYEWMYVDLPQLDFSLNISREHGYEAELGQVVQPGPVYVFGWNRIKSDYVDELPDALPSFIADRLSVQVSVFDGRTNVDLRDGAPLSVVSPKLKTDS